MILLVEDPENEGYLLPVGPDNKTNRLVWEKSPYLLQHAHNPVDWYPWGEEAFEKARKEDKPIFLSIGYSTCYWCHVMEREVFENREIADLMNRTVVSIKVDREERPDIDQVYMKALQAMTGSGGWPMSVFMTADRKPFFTGTYFPPSDRNGRIGFQRLLMHIHTSWKEERSSLHESSQQITQYLIDSSKPDSQSVELTEKILDRAFEQFAQNYDAVHGGFGSAPKFPRPVVLNFLFRYLSRTGNTAARDMALTTLRRMAEGGIYDQIGGGFHRYSTDESWHVPHFEKMLYDQAQLAISYLEAYQITHDPFYSRVVREVLAYVRDIMTSPEGGFYSAEDAESASHTIPEEKREGAYYLWRKDDIDGLLTVKESTAVGFLYGIMERGNIESDPHGEFTGENILSVNRSPGDVAERLGVTDEEIWAIINLAKYKLRADRERRPRPLRDDKIVLSWNGLMISAFARAYSVLGDASYHTHAVEASRFIMSRLFEAKTGKLFRRYRDGETKHDALLVDYAYFIQGLLDLYEASLEREWLVEAIRFTDDQIKIFYDASQGGFYEISDSDPTLIVRTKEAYDGAEPSGNSIAILNLLRLSRLIDDPRYDSMAMKSLSAFSGQMRKSPESMPQFLVAMDFSLSPPIHIVLSGEPGDPVLADMLEAIHSGFIPRKILRHVEKKDGNPFESTYIRIVEDFAVDDETVKAYVCEDSLCHLPVTNGQTLSHLLDGIIQRRIDPLKF